MKIAIIGAGISGMLAAYILQRDHDIVVFEAGRLPGGHANTVDVARHGRSYAVDTGFVVFNDRTYPGFVRLLDRLGVRSQASTMSFSVRCERTGLEYNGTSLNALFAQRASLFRPGFYRMIRDILRFNREARELLREEGNAANALAGSGGSAVQGLEPTLGDYLEARRYSREFVENHLIPIASAIWSMDASTARCFPVRRFVEFFDNHGALRMRGRPQWKVIEGGSRRYVDALVSSYRSRLRLSTPIRSIVRSAGRVEVTPVGGAPESFDAVVLATHSDQALAMLAKPSDREREILGAIPYQKNEAVLHMDRSLLPRKKRTWASWNYHIPREGGERVGITYNMNNLQDLRAPEEFCVTLNRVDSIDPAKIIERFEFHHPVYAQGAFLAQKRWGEISGANRTYYCGAYWGYGFHEDGVQSALAVCRQLGQTL